MARAPYKLSTSIFGHTGDVRAVATFADGTIVSASRDMTARVWKPSGHAPGYVENAVLRSHSNFVSSVCVVNPTKTNPKGYIITGSNDNTICVHLADQVEPVCTINAHQNTVCCLNASTRSGMFLSSSWDLTAKLWSLNSLSKPEATLLGHTAAVWCVADLPNGNIITGSADKLVIIWLRSGSILHKLTGHDGCVRGIAVVKDNNFLTCANDGSVRHWNASSAACLGTYSGHENYVYSIAALSGGTYVFTSGEDRTIRVWYNGEVDQTINLPTQSVWCINTLPNGDIVSGSSDGIIRIFSMDPQRYADAETLKRFEEEIAVAKLPLQQELGDLNVNELPDASALLQPGQKDGQTKIINEGDAVRAYSWSKKEMKWTKVGDVTGASSGGSAPPGKQTYNGKEYDYVFSVDIQEGVPPLKLPYNNCDDPWHVAQKFLHDNELSQLYLEQVANFIIKNSQSAPTLNTDAGYADPFTGANRYVPSSGMSAMSGVSGVSGVSAVSAVSASSGSVKSPSMASSNTLVHPSYIPHKKHLKLEQANPSAILEKLQELNSKQQGSLRVAEDTLKTVIKLQTDGTIRLLKGKVMSVMKILLNWPKEAIFPVLDIARLAVLRKDINDEMCTDELLQLVKRHIKSDALPTNQMLTFRLLANMFCHEKGEKLGLDNRDEILRAILDLQFTGNKHQQIAMATFLLNLVVALNKYNDTPGRTRTLNVMFTFLPRLTEPEAVFRALVALGTLLVATPDPEDRSELIRAVQQSEAALNILITMSEHKVDINTQDKVATCSKQIIDLII